MSSSRECFAIIASSAEIIHLVHQSQIMREKAQEIIQEIMKFVTENLENNPVLYAAIKNYVQHKSPAENLSEKQRYYIDELMKEFKQNGLELPAEKQAEVRAVCPATGSAQAAACAHPNSRNGSSPARANTQARSEGAPAAPAAPATRASATSISAPSPHCSPGPTAVTRYRRCTRPAGRFRIVLA